MPETAEAYAAWKTMEIVPFTRAGIDWPAGLAIAAAYGLEGETAVEYLAAGEAGLFAGLRKITPQEGNSDG